MNHPMPSLNRLALSATVHCLTGCGIGEVLGLVIATQLGWHDAPAIALAVVLAFVFGYGLTLHPLLRSGLAVRSAITDGLFWDSLAIALAVAGVAAYPVNRWLIARGRGHAVIHGRHS